MPTFKQTQGGKLYRAIINQSGESAPTAVVLYNSIGAVIWTRTSPGVYRLTLEGAFPENKISYFISPASPIFFAVQRVNDDQIYIQTQDIDGISVDSAMQNITFEVIVKP